MLTAADAPMTGVAIAAMVGLDQPRATQVLTYLAERNAVDATGEGSLVVPIGCWTSTRSGHGLYSPARRRSGSAPGPCSIKHGASRAPQ